MILLHILTALISLGLSGFLYFSPSRAKLHTSYFLVAGTLLSGTYLVISRHSPMLSSCVTGLVFLFVSIAAALLSRHKLDQENA